MSSPERYAALGVLDGARFVGLYAGEREWRNVKRQQLRWKLDEATPHAVLAHAEPVLFDVLGSVDGYTLAPNLTDDVVAFVPFREGPLMGTVMDLLSVEAEVEVIRA